MEKYTRKIRNPIELNDTAFKLIYFARELGGGNTRSNLPPEYEIRYTEI